MVWGGQRTSEEETFMQPMERRDYGHEMEAHRRMMMSSKSFTTPAIITLVLYCVLWLPGLIANIVYWREAKTVERVTGHSPEGKGCLVAMLWVFIVLPLIGGGLFIVIAIIAAIADSSS